MLNGPIDDLTREDILQAAKSFLWTKQLPKWTVIVEGRELPARPFMLAAAGVPPNNPTNSHQCIAKFKALGFETRYEGRSEQTRTWKRKINGATLVLNQRRQKSGMFIYDGELSYDEGHRHITATTRDHSEQNLGIDEIMKLPKIAELLAEIP